MQRILLLLVVLSIYTTTLDASEGSIRITGKVWESTMVSQDGQRLNIRSSSSIKTPQVMTLTTTSSSSTFILDSPSIALNLADSIQDNTELLTLSITTL